MRQQLYVQIKEAALGDVLEKKVFLKLSHNSQGNTCVCEVSANLLKKRIRQNCFPVNFVKFLRTLILQNNSG